MASKVTELPTYGTGHVVFVWTVVGGFWIVAAAALWFFHRMPHD